MEVRPGLRGLTGAQLWHGADYYPEQWLDRPDILERDLDWMADAGINVVTVGVFTWASLEPAFSV